MSVVPSRCSKRLIGAPVPSSAHACSSAVLDLVQPAAACRRLAYQAREARHPFRRPRCRAHLSSLVQSAKAAESNAPHPARAADPQLAALTSRSAGDQGRFASTSLKRKRSTRGHSSMPRVLFWPIVRLMSRSGTDLPYRPTPNIKGGSAGPPGATKPPPSHTGQTWLSNRHATRRKAFHTFKCMLQLRPTLLRHLIRCRSH
jgi:hypothetical protein